MEGPRLVIEGLAVAADPNFKTFEAAYPFVIQKLLTENSADTRKILHSVVFNKRKEFQWQRLALFLRVGATRYADSLLWGSILLPELANGVIGGIFFNFQKALQQVVASNDETSLDYLPNRAGVSDVANLVLKLLPSKDGVVLRRLIMTADGASLIRAMVSKEASFFRQQISRVIANILYQWMIESLGSRVSVTQNNSQLTLAHGADNGDLGSSSTLSTPNYDYQSFLRDKRLKVIFLKVLDPVRRDPVLMLRLLLEFLCYVCHGFSSGFSPAFSFSIQNLSRLNFIISQAICNQCFEFLVPYR
ncbi:hypothetical protein Patl1_06133 [Pistacia atlantica]|uniref:Uncharacterized protein n=1 Tax=Pistacia atlantica TaxID=434234 RepID=A0ACC1BPB3_9ROSI|nr:hypothetical protein Patl1_06133 [Pistacia atlantica]